MKNVMCKNTESKTWYETDPLPTLYKFLTSPEYVKNYQWIFLEKGVCFGF